MEDDMAIVICVGIAIHYDNYPAPYNFPEHQQQHQGNEQQGVEVWKSDGINFP